MKSILMLYGYKLATHQMKRMLSHVELYEDYKVWAEENQIELSPEFNSKSFGRSVMRKWRSKPKKVDGKAIRHYFGFKIPKSVTR